jgi:acetylornithine deacetylase/succinyl-diaminopimelate desuccinylase-like protein
MTAGELQRQATEVLQRLVRFDTVNPPGNERAAIEYLARYVSDAGLEAEILAVDSERPNLVADLRGELDGPTLCFLGHVDTVLADASEWAHDPWSGDLADGFVWGRGALDMKSQVAAEAVAGVALAREGWRPARGGLKLVFVSDEETGGAVGARWLTEERPDRVRCDMLINEGGGQSFDYGGRRHYGLCCAEKGIFRFTITAHGTAGHASLPSTGDNALVKLAPALARLADQPESFEVTPGAVDFLRGIGEDPNDPGGALRRLASVDPGLRTLLEPMFSVTLTPTMASASGKINVIPSRAELRVDCRVPPGLGEDAARRRIHKVLGDEADDYAIEFIQRVVGNESPVQSQLGAAITRWVTANDPGADTVPVILPGFSDSRWFRVAFPDCVACGFFPHRDQGLLQAAPLVHSADERVDVRDLGFATGFFADIARELLT